MKAKKRILSFILTAIMLLEIVLSQPLTALTVHAQEAGENTPIESVVNEQPETETSAEESPTEPSTEELSTEEQGTEEAESSSEAQTENPEPSSEAVSEPVSETEPGSESEEGQETEDGTELSTEDLTEEQTSEEVSSEEGSEEESTEEEPTLEDGSEESTEESVEESSEQIESSEEETESPAEQSEEGTEEETTPETESEPAVQTDPVVPSIPETPAQSSEETEAPESEPIAGVLADVYAINKAYPNYRSYLDGALEMLGIGISSVSGAEVYTIQPQENRCRVIIPGTLINPILITSGGKLIDYALCDEGYMFTVSGDTVVIAVSTYTEEQTINATFPGSKTDVSDEILLTGMLPVNAIIEAFPVDVTVEGMQIALAYDINIYAGEDMRSLGIAWQPDAGVQVQFVSEVLNPEAEELSVYHMEDVTAEPELVTVTSPENTTVSFEASGFSVYVIAEAPDPVAAPSAEYANTIAKLTESPAEDGFYISVTRTANVHEYWTSSVNNNGAFIVSQSVSEAAVWYLEPVSGTTNRFRIYTMIGGSKKYIVNTTGRELGLADSNGTPFEFSLAAGKFVIKKIRSKPLGPVFQWWKWYPFLH